MMGFAALLAYMSQWEKVNHAYTVSLSFVFLKVPKTLRVKWKEDKQGGLIMKAEMHLLPVSLGLEVPSDILITFS